MLRFAWRQPAAIPAGCLLVLALLLAPAPSAWSAPRLAAGPDAPAVAAVRTEDMAERVRPCLACHGKEGRATNDGYFPRIAGKPAGYLYNQLVHFREGRRTYPLMTYLLDHLSDDYLLAMARHFAAQHPPYPPPPRVEVGASVLERGRVLVLEGDAGKRVPACIACHGERLTGTAPAIPGLLGLPRDYLNAQFGAWKNGNRQAAAPDCMARIAARLSVADISAASAWLATRPLPDDPRPAAQPSGFTLPIACGSVPLPGAAGSQP